MSKKNLTSRVQFAKMAGVSKPSVTQACNNALKGAVCGKKIDLNHPVIVAYLEKRGRTTTSHLEPPPPPEPPPANHVGNPGAPQHYKYDDPIMSLLDKTVGQIHDQFGSDVQFREWLTSRKLLEDIRTKQIKNEEHEGDLIRKDYVQEHIFSIWDNTQKKILTSVPKTISKRLSSLFKAKGTPEQGQEIAAQVLGGYYRNLKKSIDKALRPHAR